jgi:RNA polymerase sigma-70 factor (ECF subfamily)
MTKYIHLLFTADIHKLTLSTQEQLYREFFTMVYPMVFYRVREVALVEDIIQESFIKAVSKAPHILDEKKRIAWLKKVVINATYDYLRKHNKNKHEPLEESIFIYESRQMPYKAESVEGEIETKYLKEAIQMYVEQLKPHLQLLLKMRWVDHMNYQEIADELEISINIVRQNLYRARMTIKKKLQEDWGIED